MKNIIKAAALLSLFSSLSFAQEDSIHEIPSIPEHCQVVAGESFCGITGTSYTEYSNPLSRRASDLEKEANLLTIRAQLTDSMYDQTPEYRSLIDRMKASSLYIKAIQLHAESFLRYSEENISASVGGSSYLIDLLIKASNGLSHPSITNVFYADLEEGTRFSDTKKILIQVSEELVQIEKSYSNQFDYTYLSESQKHKVQTHYFKIAQKLEAFFKKWDELNVNEKIHSYHN